MNEMSPSGVILTGLFFYRIRRGEIEFVWGSSRTVARVAVHKALEPATQIRSPSTDERKGPTRDLYLSAAYILKNYARQDPTRQNALDKTLPTECSRLRVTLQDAVFLV